MKTYKSILITGASSGLGRALAQEYAGQGISLFLSGRDETRLADTAASCRLKGAIVTTAKIDVTDAAAMQKFLRESDAEKPLDLVIANAGISETMFSDKSDSGKVFDTNLKGVLNTIEPAIEFMKARKSGQIAIISSLASFCALPSAPSYSASKVAARFYGEALRGVLASSGIGVSVICPGFIKTPMTDANKFPMPLIVSPTKAAAKIKKDLAHNRPRIAFPLPLYFLINFIGFLPPSLTGKILSSLPKKGI